MKYKTIEELIAAKSYERPDSYSGPDYFGYVSVVGQSRDSQCLERSNFEIACEMLGYDYNIPDESDDSVLVARASHWAVGWVNTLFVKIDCAEKMAIALKIANDLDNYPVLDDYHFNDLERDELEEMIKDNMEYFERDLKDYLGVGKLNKAQVKFIEYNVEESSGYYGHGDAWFRTDFKDMKRTIEFIRDNGIMSDSIEMAKFLDTLELSLEFEKLSEYYLTK